MNSKITEQFYRLFTQLPADVQRQTRAAHRLFLLGAHYRALGVLDGDTATWFWIGTHEAYNNLKV